MQMIEILPSITPQARKIFQPLEHHLLIHALFDGDITAKVFADNEQPKTGLITYNSRFIFGGDPENELFNKDISAYFHETVLPSRNGEGFLVTFTSDSWIPMLNKLFAGNEIILAPRLYFESTPQQNLEINLPKGFSIQSVTAEFLNSNTEGLDTLREEICSERTSVDDFLEKSFGVCPVYENQLAGWCLSEYNTNQACEIGIATLEPHQRKGIATALTKAFLAEATRRGYQKIGWDCWERNQASAATARKVGFAQTYREQAIVVIPK
jgi:RimJ/RimL family protein N-acetyltransferase